MFTALGTHNFAPLHCYSDASVYYNNTESVRGKPKIRHGVPLRRDRSNINTYAVHRINTPVEHRTLTNPDAPSFALRLHGTHVVKFYPNGCILVDISYTSTTTNDFASHFLYRRNRCHATTFDSKPILVLIRPTTRLNYVAKSPLLLRPNPSLEVAADEPVIVDPSTIIPMKMRRLNRSLAAKVRNKYRSLFDYATTLNAMGAVPAETVTSMLSLRGEGRSHAHARNVLGHMSAEWFMDEENFPFIVSSFYRVSHSHFPISSEWLHSLDMTEFKETVLACLYRLEGAYYDEQLPEGVIKKGMRYA